MILHAKFDGNRKAAEKPTDGRQGRGAASPAAKNLAMAHKIDRLIDQGLVRDYTHAARLLGVSQPRMTHLMALLLLAPAIQEAILLKQMVLKDKDLRQAARIAEWEAQAARIRG